MQLIPALDLLDGDIVRLRHGDFSTSTQYVLSARHLARDYSEAGADWLHVVDLAASRDGETADTSALFQLLDQASQQVQTGGGVRCSKDILARLEGGADRVVVGTVCVTQPNRFAAWLPEFGADQIVAGLDVQFDEEAMPYPRAHGWTKAGDRSLWDLLDEYASRGLKHLLCTDIGKDGAMRGPNLKLYRELVGRYPDLQVQASGGVADLRDIKLLQETGVTAAICGKALLEGSFTIQEALETLS